MYTTSSRRTVRLGSLQGVYERFPKRNLTGIVHHTQAGLYRNGPPSTTSFMPRYLNTAYRVHTVHAAKSDAVE